MPGPRACVQIPPLQGMALEKASPLCQFCCFNLGESRHLWASIFLAAHCQYRSVLTGSNEG